MVRRPAGGLHTVMAGGAARDNAVVTELSRQPAEIGMTIGAAIVHRHMMRWFTRRLHIVVAINTCAKNLSVIHTPDVLPQSRRMAGITLVGTIDMGNRFSGRFDAPRGHMAAFASPRRTLELTSNMTALTGDEIVRTEKVKAGCSMIEGFDLLGFLRRCNTAP